MIGFQNTLQYVLRIMKYFWKQFWNAFDKYFSVLSMFDLSKLIIKFYMLKRAKIHFFDKKVKDFDIFIFKIGAFKAEKSYESFECHKSFYISYLTSLVNFIIIPFFKPPNAPFLSPSLHVQNASKYEILAISEHNSMKIVNNCFLLPCSSLYVSCNALKYIKCYLGL